MSGATCDDIEQHIAAIEALYVPLITGNADRLEHGGKLLDQFMGAVVTYQKCGRAAVTAVIERVNELAVARIILSDPTLASAKVFYEPRIAADGRRIDFVVPEAEGGCLYIEVKTVQPAAEKIKIPAASCGVLGQQGRRPEARSKLRGMHPESDSGLCCRLLLHGFTQH